MSVKDPYHPCRRTVFKINDGSAIQTVNGRAECLWDGCYAPRKPDGKPLQRCSGCLLFYFCSREHQVASWPRHKQYCKNEQRFRKMMEFCPPDIKEEENTRQTMRYTLQDWILIHERPLKESLARGIAEMPSFNEIRQCFRFELDYHPEAEGNPATTFTIASVKIITPTLGTLEAMWHERFRYSTAYFHVMESKVKKTPGYISTVPCQYFVNGKLLWVTQSILYQNSFKAGPPPPGYSWYGVFQQYVAAGIVFRLEGDDEAEQEDWALGMVSKRDNKWVWKKHTSEEFAKKGILLLKVPKKQM